MKLFKKDLSVLNAKTNYQLKKITFYFEQLIYQCVDNIMTIFALFCNVRKTLPPDVHSQTGVGCTNWITIAKY